MKYTSNIILVLVAAGCLWASSVLDVHLDTYRHSGISGPTDSMDSAPPPVVLTTVLLGGFRGIIADILWLRASLLQDKHDYFELVQLADWVTKLEPRFPEVWAFHAWNLAYNISVMLPQPEDRWRWVMSGIKLLREEGIVYNPRESQLFFELAWIFQNKIGADYDTAHMYYKTTLASEMEDILGGPRTDYRNIPDELKTRLAKEFRMKTEIMQRIENTFGPLDWRLPHSHAVYWAFTGRDADPDRISLQCDRVIFQSLSHLFENGTLTFDKSSNLYRTAPDPNLLQGVINSYELALAAHNDRTIVTGFRSFLRKAVFVLDELGKKEQAALIFERLRKEFPDEEFNSGYETFIEHFTKKKIPGIQGRQSNMDPPE